MHGVQVQLVELEGSALGARVEGDALEPELVSADVQRPAELVPVQVEGQDAVESCGSEIQASFVDRDLVAMAEIRVAP